MPSIEIPNTFEVSVSYGITLPPAPEHFAVTVSLAGVTLFSRTYTDDREIVTKWRRYIVENKDQPGYVAVKRPPGYASDGEDARETAMVEFAEKLAEVLGRPDPMARY